MVAALNSWWPDTILFRSTDAGATWTRIWDWAGYPSRSFRYTQNITGAPWLTFNANPPPPEVAPKLGWMVGDLEIDPFDSDRLLYGTGATIYGSDNLTAWDTGGQIGISVRAQGLEETAVLDLISPPAGAPLLSGLGDIGGFRHDSLSAVPAAHVRQPHPYLHHQPRLRRAHPELHRARGQRGHRQRDAAGGLLVRRRHQLVPGPGAGRGERRRDGGGRGQRQPGGLEPRGRERARLHEQRQLLDAVPRHPGGGARGGRPREPGEVLRLRRRHVLPEHQRRRRLRGQPPPRGCRLRPW